MKKVLFTLGLLGFLAQPVFSQTMYTGAPVIRPGEVTGAAAPVYTTTCPATCPVTGAAVPLQTTTVAPGQVAIARDVTTGAAVPIHTPGACITGGAAPVATGTSGTVQQVEIPKKRWWNWRRTGYRAVCPVAGCPTGGAASIAAPVSVAAAEPVLVPKRHFWESDKIQMMPVSPPAAVTGGAAPICPSACPVPTGGAAPLQHEMMGPTGGATGMETTIPPKTKTKTQKTTGGAAPVRGYW